MPATLEYFTFQGVYAIQSVAQLCLTLRDSMDCSLPGSSVHGLSWARILKWVAMLSSGESSQPRNQTTSPTLQVDSLSEAPGKPKNTEMGSLRSPGDLPYPGIKLGSPGLQADSLPVELPGRPHCQSLDHLLV